MVPNPSKSHGLGSFSPNTQATSSQRPLLLRRLCWCANRIPSPRQSSRKSGYLSGLNAFLCVSKQKSSKIQRYLWQTKTRRNGILESPALFEEFFLCLNKNTASFASYSNKSTADLVYGIRYQLWRETMANTPSLNWFPQGNPHVQQIVGGGVGLV